MLSLFFFIIFLLLKQDADTTNGRFRGEIVVKETGSGVRGRGGSGERRKM